MAEIKTLMASRNYTELHKLLAEKPALANTGIPFDDTNPAQAHPLHRLCDAVFTHVLTDDEAVAIARILIEHGADINGGALKDQQDTPLIAAASLLAEKVGILYVEQGANIHHAGTHGGTALHWAAWTGQDKLVDCLIRAGADIHKPSVEFESAPLLWAIHGYKSNNGDNVRRQIECVRLLLDAGANKYITNKEGKPLVAFLDDADTVLKAMLS